MALTFPLPIADWMDRLNVEDVTFDAPPQVEMSQTGGGEYLVRQLAPTLWRGTVTTRNMRLGCGSARAALLAALQQPGASFMVYNKRRPTPQDDPTGSVIAGSSVTINSVLSNGDVRFAGLPANYQLRAGDYFSFDYGSNPVRKALHQLLQDTRAGAGGQSVYAAVHPPIRPGWSGAAVIRFNRPVCKAVIVPGSVSETGFSGLAVAGLSFRWQQTLR